MIFVKVDVSDAYARDISTNNSDRPEGRVDFNCPMCGKNLIYYLYCQKRCYECKSAIVDITALLYNEKYRLLWHRDRGSDRYAYS